MKLACNNHPPLRQLLAEGRVEVDFLKVTSLERLDAEVEDALRYRPALIHVGFGIADSVVSYADLDWAWFNRVVRRSGSPHVALHLEVSMHNWSGASELRYQSSADARAMVAHLGELCRFLQRRLACPLLLENMDYMGSELTPGYGVFRTSVEPALMWQLVEEEGPACCSTWLTSASPPLTWGWTLERTDAQILTLEYPKARTMRQPLAVQPGALERQLTRLKGLAS